MGAGSCRVMPGDKAGNTQAVPHEEEAAIWFARLRAAEGGSAGGVGGSVEERAEFEAWLRADARHAEAWAAIGHLWSALDACEAELATGREAPAPLRRRALWKPVAATAVAASAAGLWWAADPVHRADWRTGAGERRSLELADGTSVEMDAGTALDTALDGPVRQVRLLSGQAFFTVRAAARPFEVVAEEGAVRAEAAAFGVTLLEQGARIAPAQGEVAVRHAARQVVLRAAEGAEYGASGLRGPWAADPAMLFAWRRDQMILRGARLREVMRDLERYRGGRILLTDRAAGNISVSGAFSTLDPDAVLDAIGSALPVRIRRLAGYLVLVSSA